MVMREHVADFLFENQASTIRAFDQPMTWYDITMSLAGDIGDFDRILRGIRTSDYGGQLEIKVMELLYDLSVYVHTAGDDGVGNCVMYSDRPTGARVDGPCAAS